MKALVPEIDQCLLFSHASKDRHCLSLAPFYKSCIDTKNKVRKINKGIFAQSTLHHFENINLLRGVLMAEQNDPRVFFAAERTLLAWNRTSLTLMAFGFVIERFGLFVHMLFSQKSAVLQRSASFWIGLAFIILGAVASSLSVVQYRKLLRDLPPAQIPSGYQVHTGVFLNLMVAALGVALTFYLFAHGPNFQN